MNIDIQTASREELCRIVDYDAETGSLTWLVPPGGKGRVGEPAGCVTKQGYVIFSYKGKKMPAAQLVWFLHHGERPNSTVRAIDGDATNLRISNLRLGSDKSFLKEPENNEKTDFSYEEMASVFDYNPETGSLKWKVTLTSRAKAGDDAGYAALLNGKWYTNVTYRGTKISASHVAWLLSYKHWPDRTVFFVDGNPANLKLSNLKLADFKSIREVTEDGSLKYVIPAIQTRHYGLMGNYNLTITEYAKMYADQNGVCAICGNPETALVPGRKTEKNEGRTRDLSVDHCHATGKIRGLLCNACNHILGEAKDDANRLRAAANYLERHNR